MFDLSSIQEVYASEHGCIVYELTEVYTQKALHMHLISIMKLLKEIRTQHVLGKLNKSQYMFNPISFQLKMKAT